MIFEVLGSSEGASNSSNGSATAVLSSATAAMLMLLKRRLERGVRVSAGAMRGLRESSSFGHCAWKENHMLSFWLE